MIRVAGGVAWFADRPGNRRADSFRNILKQPRIAIAALVPGFTQVALLSGEARYDWEHRITPGDQLRFSITFRTLSDKGRRIAEAAR